MVLSEKMMRVVKLGTGLTTFGVGWYVFLEADYSGIEFNKPEQRARRHRRLGTKAELESEDEHVLVPLQRWYRTQRDKILLGVNVNTTNKSIERSKSTIAQDSPKKGLDPSSLDKK